MFLITAFKQITPLLMLGIVPKESLSIQIHFFVYFENTLRLRNHDRKKKSKKDPKFFQLQQRNENKLVC